MSVVFLVPRSERRTPGHNRAVLMAASVQVLLALDREPTAGPMEGVFGVVSAIHSDGMGDTSTIVETAEYLWRQWERYRRVPSGCHRRNWEEPNFYVCAARLSASKREVKEAFEGLGRKFDHVRVNSRNREWEVFAHDAVSDKAAFWTLELGEGCSRPGDAGPEQVCLAIAIDNER
jgi:hypothetical protein